jgi:hypothetical protein
MFNDVNEEPKWMPIVDHGLALELEVTYPPSRAGRTVYLMLNKYDVTDLLKLLRSAAREARL